MSLTGIIVLYGHFIHFMHNIRLWVRLWVLLPCRLCHRCSTCFQMNQYEGDHHEPDA